MKLYSRLIMVIAIVLALAVLMIACGTPDAPNLPAGDTADSTTVGSDTNALGNPSTPMDTIDFNDMTQSSDVSDSTAGTTDGTNDGTTEESESESETESSSNESNIPVGGVVPDDGKHFGEIIRPNN